MGGRPGGPENFHESPPAASAHRHLLTLTPIAVPATPRLLPIWPEPLNATSGASRRPALRVALALGAVALATLAVHEAIDLGQLPEGSAWEWLSDGFRRGMSRGWTAGAGVGLGGLGAALMMRAVLRLTGRRRAVPAVGEVSLLAALVPLIERTARSLRVTQGTLGTAIGLTVTALHLPTAMVGGLVRLTQDALDHARHQTQGQGHLRLELDLLDGETGLHVRLAVIHPNPTRTPAATPGVTPLHRRTVASMQRQATALGAQLDIGHDERGNCIEWVLALPAVAGADRG
jgi:hypothetical protein